MSSSTASVGSPAWAVVRVKTAQTSAHLRGEGAGGRADRKIVSTLVEDTYPLLYNVGMRTVSRLAVFVALSVLLPSAAYAQNTGPCAYVDIEGPSPGALAAQSPPVIGPKGGTLTTTLTVKYTDPSLVSIANCPVTLRSYNGQLVGPTLRVRPGDTMAIHFVNALPAQTPDQAAADQAQESASAFLSTTPNPFNTTNLHLHGLHVSPTGNSDNVLLAIPPQSSFDYEVHIPKDHPAGTFWYHAHAHGSTAVQVGSSMAGAIVIEDDPGRLPEPLRGLTEQVMVIQTILYDTTGRVDDITAFFPDSASTKKLCEAGAKGCTWQNSKRRTTVNGQITPTITMAPGEIQRWRMIDATFRESLALQLRTLKGGVAPSLNEIALDGIYTGRVDVWTPTQSVDLEAGYRSDVLVQAGMEEGVYMLIDGAETAATGVRGIVEDENILAYVVVKGKVPKKARSLPTDAQMAALAPFGTVDLRKTADGVQEVSFKLGSAADPTDGRNYFQVNYQSFNPDRVRYVQLGATDVWNLSTIGDPAGIPAGGGIPALPHLFHIHVNPFQTLRLGPKGDTQLVWKDTLLVNPPTVDAPSTQIWTQYTDYIGPFVMHCHILDHEDLGMMEVVEVIGDVPLPAGH